jgi:hypothetical protein
LLPDGSKLVVNTAVLDASVIVAEEEDELEDDFAFRVASISAVVAEALIPAFC